MKKTKYNFKGIMEGMLGTFGFKTPKPESVKFADGVEEQTDDHEHEAEYQPAEPDVNVPQSNTCKHCGVDMPLPELDPDFGHDDIPLPPPADEVEGMIIRNDPGKAKADQEAQGQPSYHTAPSDDPNYDPDMPNFSFYRWMKQNEPGEFNKMTDYNKKKKGIPTESKQYWDLMTRFAQLNEYESDTKYEDEEANCPHDLGKERSDDKDWDEYDAVTNKEPRIDALTSAQDEPDEEEDKKVDEQSLQNYEKYGSEFSLKGIVTEKAFKDREGEYRKIGSVQAKSEEDPAVSDAFKGYPSDEYWIRAIKKPNEGKFELYVRKKPTKYTRTRVPKDLYDFVDEVVEDENKWYGHIPSGSDNEKD